MIKMTITMLHFNDINYSDDRDDDDYDDNDNDDVKVPMMTTMIVMCSYFSSVKFSQPSHGTIEKQTGIPTTTVCWCFPSNGKNSLIHTSKPLELTFSNQTYTASLGFVARVYFAETKTKGLAAKLWNFENLRQYIKGKIIGQSFLLFHKSVSRTR